ncbi:hypothetical protein LEP1GSC188_4497 [Leptospira weilii serovar Topaz str. LT2116]|uniref:Uncharacterized protein n=1 Tax=Leptospira weilii serovar Topaz str. LT2116 TaxID=1088540 RepID=M3EQ82_9LEPT|nr:hypothetical protein LEP1GSC188_4497 [Leptospira weilii serovar Topaz str. LT2116]
MGWLAVFMEKSDVFLYFLKLKFVNILLSMILNEKISI